MAYPSNQPDPDSRTDKTSPAPPVTYAEQLSCQAGRPAALLGILIAFAFYFTLTPWISLAITAVRKMSTLLGQLMFGLVEFVSSGGLLIQAATGRACGTGWWRTNRSGWAA